MGTRIFKGKVVVCMEKGFINLLRSLTGPLVLFHATDGDLIPEDLKFHIELERLIQTKGAGINGEVEKATDLETMAYLMSASFAFPLDRDWVNIYSYLVHNYVKRWKKQDVPDFLKEHDKISDYEKRLLEDLKIWIKKQQSREYSRKKPKLKTTENDKDSKAKQQKVDGFLRVA